jgi:hypothetical protein
MKVSLDKEQRNHRNLLRGRTVCLFIISSPIRVLYPFCSVFSWKKVLVTLMHELKFICKDLRKKKKISSQKVAKYVSQ